MEWLGYEPEDFLLFAPRTYWRLFELENAAREPLTPFLPVLGLLAIAVALRPRPWSGRLVWAALAAGWIWSGLVFVGERYATINWAAAWAAPVFAAEAAAVAWFGTVRGRLGPLAPVGAPGRLGLSLAVWAVALHPLLAPLDGRPLHQAEIVGVAPDPTALLTLGLLALAPRGLAPTALALVPAVWCAASAATLLAMGEWQGWVVLAGTGVGAAARLAPGFLADARNR